MRIFIILFLLIICAPFSAHAENRDYSSFEILPILHEGRIKPLSSFARINLKQLSGHEHLDGLTPAAWLAETLFNPPQAAQRAVFAVRDPELKTLLKLPENEHLFTLAQLQPGLEKTAPQLQTLLTAPRETLTQTQIDLLQLHEDTLSFMELLRSLSMLLPLDVEIPKSYQKSLAEGDLTYQQIAKIEPRVMADLKKLVDKKGENPDTYSDAEKQLAQLAFNLQIFRSAANNNDALRILPGGWDDNAGLWVSPWALGNEGQGGPENAAYLELWKDMATAYREDNTAKWNEASTAAINYTHDNFAAQVSFIRLRAEKFYSLFKPFHWALALYTLSLPFIFVAAFGRKRIFERAAFATLGLGAAAHLSGIALRVFILARPPVGTLHESVLFVSLICAVLALITGLKSKNYAAIFSGALAGAGLLAIAPSVAQGNESMEMLVAVLNTNFWLATHVLCITAGYGLCVLSACSAHIYILARYNKKPAELLARLQQTAYHFSLAALLLTAVGTVLGGIWADQSWGRFWGWDPKENGALLIVLWLIWTQHGRISGHLRPLPFMATLGLLNVVVALAWFGVNLLSVGLHSYGFTNGIAAGLGLFCGAELMLITGLFIAIRYRERSPHVA